MSAGTTESLFDVVTNERVIPKSIEEFLIDSAVNGPQVTIATVIELVQILKNRVNIGQSITMEGTGTILKKANFWEYADKHFTDYVCDNIKN
ncbi:hypothetical protein P261_01134 [Lachnospiraceae bacterium TWA4]|nr:hypothetical protein P261_01134 [Lachnospiraceae bacterium TWA4]